MSSTQSRSTRAGASLMSNTANSGAEQSSLVRLSFPTHTHIANPAFILLWVRILGFKTHRFVTTSLRPHPRSVGPRVRPGTFQQRLTSIGGRFLSQPFFVAEMKVRGFWQPLFLISMRCCLEIETTFPSLILHGRRLGGRQQEAVSLDVATAK